MRGRSTDAPGWRDPILQHFTPAIASVARLTIVADPDELLTEQGIVEAIRDRGFDLIPFEDHIEFRFEYESHYLDLLKFDQHQPDYLKINPDGTIPAMVHGDLVLTESTPMMEYIDEAFEGPPLRPKDPESRWRMRWWMRFFDSYFAPSLSMIGWSVFVGPAVRQRDPKELEAAIERIPLESRKIAWRKAMFNQFSEAELAESRRRVLFCTGVLEQHFGDADDRVQRRAQLVRHVGQELGLVLARGGELFAFLLDLLEVPRILHGEHGLAGERLQQPDDPLGKLGRIPAPDDQPADHAIFPQQRHREQCAEARALPELSRILRVALDVGDMDDRL